MEFRFFGTLFLNVEMPKKMKKTAKRREGSKMWKDKTQILFLPLSVGSESEVEMLKRITPAHLQNIQMYS